MFALLSIEAKIAIFGSDIERNLLTVSSNDSAVLSNGNFLEFEWNMSMYPSDWLSSDIPRELFPLG